MRIAVAFESAASKLPSTAVRSPGVIGKTMCVQPLAAGSEIALLETASLLGGPATGSSKSKRSARFVFPRLKTSIAIPVTPAAS